MDPTVTLVIALLFTGVGGALAWILGRPRAPQPSVLAAQEQVFAVMREHMAQLTREVGAARAESAAARQETDALRLEYAALARQGTTERADLQRQIFAARAELAIAQASLDAFRRSVQAEPGDVIGRILGRLPPPEPPPKPGTGPLPPLPPGVRAVLPTAAQAPLLAILLGATWVTGSKEARTLLLRDLPPAFVVTLERADDAKTDLVVLLDRAATWPVLAGERALLGRLLDTAQELIPPGTQAHEDLRAWRAQWQL